MTARPDDNQATILRRLDDPFAPFQPAARSGMLEVGGGHSIYWEETGLASGVPVLVVHGGPGGAIQPYYSRLLDHRRHRGILFEQRGCGRSTPTGELKDNTTTHLIQDMEALRTHLQLERWIVLGGSWGSLLSLAYAQSHPEAVIALVVSGVFLARPEDIDWWWRGIGWIYPEIWQRRLQLFGAKGPGSVREEALRQCLHDDPEVWVPAALALVDTETQLLEAWPNPNLTMPPTDTLRSARSARIQAHYDAHGYFVGDEPLLEKCTALRDTPGAIVNGRFDICTPPAGAAALQAAWPKAHLSVVASAGHRWSDPLIAQEVANALRVLTPSR
jgi:proline iminopeptidase